MTTKLVVRDRLVMIKQDIMPLVYEDPMHRHYLSAGMIGIVTMISRNNKHDFVVYIDGHFVWLYDQWLQPSQSRPSWGRVIEML